MILLWLQEAALIGWLVGLHVFTVLAAGQSWDATIGKGVPWVDVGLQGWMYIALISSPLTPYLVWLR